MPDDNDLAPLHRNLLPVWPHVCGVGCDHAKLARDYPSGPVPRCSRCGDVAHRMWNRSTTPMRRGFMCLELS